MKFLIDTGANKNYISSDHVNIENCKDEPVSKVTNVKGTYTINKSASFDPFQVNKKLKFYVFKFHKFFDGLIGYESLRDLNAKIDVRKNTLKIGRKTFNMKKRYPDDHKINLTEQEFQFIKLKTKKEGDFLVEEEKLYENFSILPGLYRSNNRIAFVAVQNHSKNPLEINTNELKISNDLENEMENDPFDLTDLPKTVDPVNYSFRDDHMSEEEKLALEKVIKKNKEVLYAEKDKLTFTHKIKHRIRTVDNIPVHSKSYKYPYVYEKEVQDQVKKMLADGIIKESISPYTSPVWVVPKKTDASGKKKFRLVIDYRKLNEKTINDKYPIPEITDILDKLGRAKYFSTIDLVSGFHQIQLAEEDTEKTSFSVNGGKYEFTRMPFGLKNAPATFQRVMDCILRDLVGGCCFVYMDDIIIFSSSLQEHAKHLALVLAKLREARLKIQLDKCEFFRKETQFLGHTVSEDGVRPNSDKIDAIRQWPMPTCEKEVRQFLGMLGYYRRFIKDFAKIVKPLTALLRKDAEFEITPEVETCFRKCKQLLMLDPVLIYPDFSKEFLLTTDASDHAIGAVLSQGHVGNDRPIAYASRTLNRTEERYSTTEKEFLAIIWAVNHFRPYLYGRKFKMFTDHQPLTYACNNANHKIIRGKLALEEFDYELIYKPGKQNVVADALSRINISKHNEKSNDSDAINNINAHSHDSFSLNVEPSERGDESDPEEDDMTIHSADTSDDYFIPYTEKPINTFRTQVIFKISNIDIIAYEQIFPKYHRHTIAKKQYTEEEIVQVLKQTLNPKGISCLKVPIALVQLVQETFKKHFSENKIYKVFISEVLLDDVRMDDQQDEIVRNTHNYGHRGMKENKIQILQKYFFPTLDRKIKIFIDSCDICKKAKYDRKPPKLIRKSTFGETPFDRVHIDIFFLKGQKWLTIVDSFSKFANAIPLNTRTIIDLKAAVTEHIRQFGRPKTIVSDQEPAFRSIDFIGFLNDLDIEIHFASNSNSNGVVERFHSTLIEIFRTNKPKFNDLSTAEMINIAIDIYNNTFHAATKNKPRNLIFNNSGKTNVEEICEKFKNLQSAAKIELMRRKEKYEELNKNNETPKTINPGENKYVKISLRQNKDKNPYKTTIVKDNNELTFVDNNNVKIHKNRIKN